MPNYEFKLGAHFDILDRHEMSEIVDKQTKLLLAHAEGIKHLDFTATGVISGGAVTIPSANPAASGQLQIPILGPEDGYYWSLQRVTVDGLAKYFTPTFTPSQPAVPASGSAQQNVNSYPVQVVVTGGTVTGVAVNGITVGTGDGTYVVPAYGAITLTYSIAPTWTWTEAAQSGLVPNTDILTVYKNFPTGANHLFSLSATTEWEFPGSHAGTLKGGDTMIITGSGLNSTGTLTISGEAIQVPAVQFAKLIA